MPGPAQIVSGPIPVAPSDGLRGARGLGVTENPNDPEDPNGDWRRGYQFHYGPCGDVGLTGDPCGTDEAKLADHGPHRLRLIEPFLAIAGRSCSTFGWEAADYATDAERLLAAYQYRIIASELWGGHQAKASGWTNPDPVDGPGNPYLTGDWQPDFVDLSEPDGGTALPPVRALAELEQALCCSASGGLIHMSRRLATIYAAFSLIVREGGRLFTPLGTQVIADCGYDGSGYDSIDNPEPTSSLEYMYGTGPLTIRIDTQTTLTPPREDFAAAVDRRTNTIAYFAERLASVSWGCCHIGVAVDPVLPL